MWTAFGGAVSDSDIFAAYSDDTGLTWSNAVRLSNYSTNGDGINDKSAVVACGSGQCIAMWQSPYGSDEGDGDDIIISRSEDGGQTWGAPLPFKHNTGAGYKPFITTDSRGNWVAAWRSTFNLSSAGSDSDIFYTYSTDNSFQWSAVKLLNTTAKVDGTATDSAIRIAPDGHGHWVGVWQSNYALTPDIGTDYDIFSTNFLLGPLDAQGQNEGVVEGIVEGGAEGIIEGGPEGSAEGGGSEGVSEGIAEGSPEGLPEGNLEAASEGEINIEGSVAGEENPEGEGIVEGLLEGQGTEGEGQGEGVPPAEGEGGSEGEGAPAPSEASDVLQGLFDADANADGKLDFAEASAAFALEQQDFEAFDSNASGYLTIAELQRQVSGTSPLHNADTNGDGTLSLAEALRVIQLYNAGGYDCTADPDDSEDGYAPAVSKGLSGGCLPHASDYLGGADGKISLSELLRFIQLYNLGAIVPCEEAGEDGFCPAP